MSHKTIRVLLVEDSQAVADVLLQALGQTRYGHFTAERVDTLAAGVARLQSEPCDVVLLDLSLPDSRGLSTVERMHAAAGGRPIVVLTSTDDDTIGTEALRRGAEDYLIKGQADSRLICRALCYAIERRKARMERELLISELSAALAKVKQLSGLLPICSVCKKVRDDKGYWNQIEEYIHAHTEAEFSHSICPGCAQRLYGGYLSDSV